MLEDSEAKIILTQSFLNDKVSFTGTHIFVDQTEIFSGDKSNLENINQPSDLIYLIYIRFYRKTKRNNVRTSFGK